MKRSFTFISSVSCNLCKFAVFVSCDAVGKEILYIPYPTTIIPNNYVAVDQRTYNLILMIK